jgi:hypothetical protein
MLIANKGADMSDHSSGAIEYRTVCRLSDQLKLQFWCTLSAFRYVWVIFAVLLVMLFISNGGSIEAIQDDPWSLAFPLAFGLVGGFGLGPAIVATRWAMGKMPKEIRADINDGGIKVIGEDFNYEAKWPSLSWVKEGRSAYVLKFKRLFIRLPKRGFTPEQEVGFRRIIHAQESTSANRLKS